MSKRHGILASLAASVVALMIGGGPAQANILPRNPGTVEALGGGVYRYTFVVDLDALQDVWSATYDPPGAAGSTGKADWFTFYDVGSASVTAVSTPAEWTAVVEATNADKTAGQITDDASQNIRYNYTNDPNKLPGAVMPIGTFVFDTDLLVGSLDVEASAHSNQQPYNKTYNSGTVNVRAIPEAATLGVLLPMLAPLGLTLRRWR